MNATTITPKDEADWLAMRKQDVTSTESAALFGMSPYLTHFDLWHRKHSGNVPEFKTNERMKWGNRLESAIAHGIAEEQGWKVSPMKEYMRLPTSRIGSSFDFVITSLGEPVHLEIKNVDYLAFRDGWIEHDDGTIDSVSHQVYEMLFKNTSWEFETEMVVYMDTDPEKCIERIECHGNSVLMSQEVARTDNKIRLQRDK